jgi:hypothetical protein
VRSASRRPTPCLDRLPPEVHVIEFGSWTAERVRKLYYYGENTPDAVIPAKGKEDVGAMRTADAMLETLRQPRDCDFLRAGGTQC